MSNIASTLVQKQKRSPQAPPPGAAENAFMTGTRNLLDEARGMVENAAQQGQELNPSIYQMLGMDPIYQDHTDELNQSQGEFDAAQKQLDEAQTTLAQIQGIPKGKRSPAQKKQFKQLKKQMPALQSALEKTRDAHGRLATSPKTITGFNRLDPNNIPANSPFSAQNPLYQAQQTESQRLNQYLAGGEVDPTLKHQYDAAEATMRQNLQAKYGPDYENSTVGQMALQNFARQKNEAFATYNQQMVERYNQLAFGGAANLQTLAGNQISLLREPGRTTAQEGADLSNLSGARISQQTANLQERAAQHGMNTSLTQANPIGTVGGGLGALLTTPYQTTDASGNPTTSTLGGAAARGAVSGAGSLYNWATGAGAGAGAGAGVGAAADAAAAYNTVNAGETAAALL